MVEVGVGENESRRSELKLDNFVTEKIAVFTRVEDEGLSGSWVNDKITVGAHLTDTVLIDLERGRVVDEHRGWFRRVV